jgi:hypothetical protein
MNDSVPEAGTPAEDAALEQAPTEAAPVSAGAEQGPAPAPLYVSRTPTGNADVDGRLERLADADHLATDGHLQVYEDVHRGLRDALTALDARLGAPAPPSPYRQGS